MGKTEEAEEQENREANNRGSPGLSPTRVLCNLTHKG